MQPLLAVDNLKTTFRTRRGMLTAVDRISFTLHPGEVMGLVGESGSGKSITSRSIMGLVPQPPGKVEGSIQLNGKEILGQPGNAWQRIRGEQIAMVFQDPMTSLNPVYPIGEQVMEALRFHKKLDQKNAQEYTVDLFMRVGLPAPKERLGVYPHQLSGGMRQRVMIAMAIACGPRLLIADEPTTALDVTIQAQILDLLRTLNNDTGMALLLITHDLGIVAELCQNVMVMYAGRIMEKTSVANLFEQPLHPYTLGLIQSRPEIDRPRERLQPIPGSPPDLIHIPSGCPFHPRCRWSQPLCEREAPELQEYTRQHWSACHFSREILREVK
jgi:peptide/nickel transport system ATP-binding protein